MELISPLPLSVTVMSAKVPDVLTGLTLVVGGVLLRVVRGLDEAVLRVGDVAPAVPERALGGHEHVPEGGGWGTKSLRGLRVIRYKYDNCRGAESSGPQA